MNNDKIEDYKNPYGTWKVTTEGDVEGRSTRQLGTYTGYIDEIAFALADKCYYELHFTKVHPEELDLTPKKSMVVVGFDYESGINKFNKQDKVDYLNNNLLKDRPCFAEYRDNGLVLTTKQETLEDKRQKVLAKLTEEERRLLGA